MSPKQIKARLAAIRKEQEVLTGMKTEDGKVVNQTDIPEGFWNEEKQTKFDVLSNEAKGLDQLMNAQQGLLQKAAREEHVQGGIETRADQRNVSLDEENNRSETIVNAFGNYFVHNALNGRPGYNGRAERELANIFARHEGFEERFVNLLEAGQDNRGGYAVPDEVAQRFAEVPSKPLGMNNAATVQMVTTLEDVDVPTVNLSSAEGQYRQENQPHVGDGYTFPSGDDDSAKQVARLATDPGSLPRRTIAIGNKKITQSLIVPTSTKRVGSSLAALG